jgi:periplasmic protein TonB
MTMADTGPGRSCARLPRRTVAERVLQFGVSAVMHAVAIALIATMVSRIGSRSDRSDPSRPTSSPNLGSDPVVRLPRIVFQLPRGPGAGGGGGGGNRDRHPIRQAEGRGRDRATLQTRQTVPTTGTSEIDHEDDTPAVLLDARPLASGESVHAGLPSGGVSFGTSLGPGSGGGVGTGSGTGIGSGRGPGIGPGSGGGIGGGVYRAGGNVTAPRLLLRVDPRYTADALERRIQGSVWLDVVVARNGQPANIRVVRSLDPSLDAEAVAALQRWRFAPGLLTGSPVDVEVTVIMDFWIH